MRVAVLTVSDRSSRGERADLGGPAVAAAAEARGWTVVDRAVVADDRTAVSAKLAAWCDGPAAPDLVLTTGGTGFGPRDLTPEATRDVIEREAPGLAEKMRREGERTAPAACLSRGVCGARGRTVILNLPGSPKGAAQSVAAVADLLEHAAAMLAGGDHAG